MNRPVTPDVAIAPPATTAGHPRAYFEEGRHRRVYPKLVVHLVFDDMSELRLGPDTAVGRSLGHMAGWLFER
jgi:hypothetical protein